MIWIKDFLLGLAVCAVLTTFIGFFIHAGKGKE